MDQTWSRIVYRSNDQNSTDENQLRFTLTNLNFKNREFGYVTYDLLCKIFNGIIQSNTEFFRSTDKFKIDCTRRGRIRPRFYNNFDEECKARKDSVVIKNTDSFVLPCSIVVTKAYAKKDKDYMLVRMDKAERDNQCALTNDECLWPLTRGRDAEH